MVGDERQRFETLETEVLSLASPLPSARSGGGAAPPADRPCRRAGAGGAGWPWWPGASRMGDPARGSGRSPRCRPPSRPDAADHGGTALGGPPDHYRADPPPPPRRPGSSCARTGWGWSASGPASGRRWIGWSAAPGRRRSMAPGRGRRLSGPARARSGRCAGVGSTCCSPAGPPGTRPAGAGTCSPTQVDAVRRTAVDPDYSGPTPPPDPPPLQGPAPDRCRHRLRLHPGRAAPLLWPTPAGQLRRTRNGVPVPGRLRRRRGSCPAPSAAAPPARPSPSSPPAHSAASRPSPSDTVE